jgi:hypothetical protein
MSVTNYEDKFLKEEHAAAWLDEFNDWTKLGAHDKMPTFQNFKVTAENLSANLAFDKENEILAADHLSNKKAEEEPRTRIFDLVSIPFASATSKEAQAIQYQFAFTRQNRLTRQC